MPVIFTVFQFDKDGDLIPQPTAYSSLGPAQKRALALVREVCAIRGWDPITPTFERHEPGEDGPYAGYCLKFRDEAILILELTLLTPSEEQEDWSSHDEDAEVPMPISKKAPSGLHLGTTLPPKGMKRKLGSNKDGGAW